MKVNKAKTEYNVACGEMQYPATLTGKGRDITYVL